MLYHVILRGCIVLVSGKRTELGTRHTVDMGWLIHLVQHVTIRCRPCTRCYGLYLTEASVMVLMICYTITVLYM